MYALGSRHPAIEGERYALSREWIGNPGRIADEQHVALTAALQVEVHAERRPDWSTEKLDVSKTATGAQSQLVHEGSQRRVERRQMTDTAWAEVANADVCDMFVDREDPSVAEQSDTLHFQRQVYVEHCIEGLLCGVVGTDCPDTDRVPRGPEIRASAHHRCRPVG